MRDFKSLKDKIERGEASHEEIDRFRAYVESVGMEELERSVLSPEDHDVDRQMAGIWEKVDVMEAERHSSGKRRSWFVRYGVGWVAAAALLLLGVIGVFVFKPWSREVLRPVAEAKMKIIKGRNHVKLSDGTTVDLNDGSTLSVVDGFGGQERIVELEGEAFFDVAHDPSRPFKVQSGKLTTTVLGTAFDIKAYSDLNEILVTVVRGKVSVKDSQGDVATLVRDQQVTYNTTSGTSKVAELEAIEIAGWKDSYLVLDGLTMEEAAAVISKRFDVKISFKDSGVQNCHLEMSYVNGEGLERILDDLTSISQSKYKRTEAGIEITGGVSCNDIVK